MFSKQHSHRQDHPLRHNVLDLKDIWVKARLKLSARRKPWTVFMSRIGGDADFRTSLVHGRVLGKQVTKWVLRNRFQPRE